MRIHVDLIDASLIRGAASAAGATIETLTQHRSQSRRRAFEVKLTGNSARRPNGGSYGAGDDYAATWDQWGVFLGLLFGVDPVMFTTYDKSADAFSYHTGGRFDGLDADHIVIPLSHDHVFRPTGVPGEQACIKPNCTGVQRF